MTLTDRQWGIIVKLIREAGLVARRGNQDPLHERLEQSADAAYMVQVEAETAHRRAVDRGGESGGMASSAGTSPVADAPPTTDRWLNLWGLNEKNERVCLNTIVVPADCTLDWFWPCPRAVVLVGLTLGAPPPLTLRAIETCQASHPSIPGLLCGAVLPCPYHTATSAPEKT